MQYHKFGALNASLEDVEHHHPNVWALETVRGGSRLVIAAAGDHLGVVQRLLKRMKGPFHLLYVLVVPRTDTATGRYECPVLLSGGEVEAFFAEFGQFLQSDGRHHVWIQSNDSPDLVVYDRNNLIYAYGDLERFAQSAVELGMSQVAEITIPVPHTHHYHEQFDAAETRILKRWRWIQKPLQDIDE